MGARERFVQETLRTEGEKMLKYQGAAIARKTRSRSGHLLSARDIVVRGGDGMDGQLTYTHAIYERFLDMKKRSSQTGRRRSRKIHNRFIFGAYGGIARRLMYGFTEEVAAMFRSAADDVE